MSNKMNLNFDDGFKELTINNDESRVIRWNPTDVNFIDRYLDFMHFIENDFENEVEKIKIKNSKGFSAFDDYNKGEITELGNKLSEKIDHAFGYKVSEVVFQGANPASPTANGGLLFGNLIEAMGPIIEESIKKHNTARDEYIKRANQIKRQIKE